MSNDLEPFVYLPHGERMELERLKNEWMNKMLDQIALAPGHTCPTTGHPCGSDTVFDGQECPSGGKCIHKPL